jgi:hypothetical protein
VAGFGAWLWTASPLSPAVRVDGLGQFFDRFAPLHGDVVPLAPIATVVVACIVITGLVRLLHGLWDLMFGGPPVGPWAVGF